MLLIEAPLSKFSKPYHMQYIICCKYCDICAIVNMYAAAEKQYLFKISIVLQEWAIVP